jgi:hypothetical protein
VAPYVAGGSRIEATLPLDDELLTEANRLYDSKYHYGPGSNWVNFLVRPRIVYGWRSEDVKTATRWTFPEQT